MAIAEVRPFGDRKHFVVYTEDAKVEKALRGLDHCFPLGTYYNPKGLKFAQDLMFESKEKGQVLKMLKAIRK